MQSRSRKSSPKNAKKRSPEARTFRLTIEYDGSAYYGWQRQSKYIRSKAVSAKRGLLCRSRAPSVQETLERAASRIAGRFVRVVGAGRTDRGVHARGQVAHLRASFRLTGHQLLRALNANTPPDICVYDVKEMPSVFHARYDARRKVYQYTILNQALPSPLHRMTAWHVPFTLNINSMRRAVKSLKGRHDFRSFQSAGSRKRGSTIRRIDRLSITRRGPLIIIEVEGDGFLYNMVRSIVGLLVEVGRGRIDLKDVPVILRKRDRGFIPKSSPANGLCLIRVRYS